jgi:hypothetical protein
VVTLEVDEVASVPGFRDLLSGNLKPDASDFGLPQLPVAVSRDLLGDALPGWHLRLRVKQTPNGPMAERHPAPGELLIAPTTTAPSPVTKP